MDGVDKAKPRTPEQRKGVRAVRKRAKDTDMRAGKVAERLKKLGEQAKLFDAEAAAITKELASAKDRLKGGVEAFVKAEEGYHRLELALVGGNLSTAPDFLQMLKRNAHHICHVDNGTERTAGSE